MGIINQVISKRKKGVSCVRKMMYMKKRRGLTTEKCK